VKRFELKYQRELFATRKFVLYDVTGNLDRQRQRLIGSDNGSAWVGGGSAFINPGSRKVAGETLCEAFMPLQPLAVRIRAEPNAIHNILVFNLT